MKIEDIVNELLKASVDIFVGKEFKNDTSFSERKFLAELSLSLQKEKDWVVVNECPYSHGLAGGQFADMYIEVNASRKTKPFRIWVEFKPLVRGFKYWGEEKFKTVLNDIDKIENIVNRQDYFIFMILLDTTGDKRRKLKSTKVIDRVEKKCKESWRRKFEFNKKHDTDQFRLLAYYC